MTRSGKARSVAVFLASVGLVAWCAWFLWKDDALSRAIAEGDARGGAVVCALAVVFLWANGRVLTVMTAGSGARVTGWESFNLSVVTNAGNSFLPLSAGMALRALYLKRRHDVSVGYFMGSLAGVYVVNYLVVFGVGASAMWFLYAGGHGSLLPWASGFTAAACGLGALAARPRLVEWLPGPVAGKARRVMRGWTSLLAERGPLLRISVLVVLNLVVSSLMMLASFLAAGVELSAGSALFLSVVNALAIFVKLTPGNLGINELLLVGGGTALRLEPGTIVLASAIMRLAQYGVLVAILPFSLWGLFGSEGWTMFRAAARSGGLEAITPEKSSNGGD